MNRAAFPLEYFSGHTAKIESILSGYFERELLTDGNMTVRQIKDDRFLRNDRWTVHMFADILQFQNAAEKNFYGKSGKQSFAFHQKNLSLEAKLIAYNKIFSGMWSVSNLLGNQKNHFSAVSQYMTKYHKDKSSFLQLSAEDDALWLMWLTERGRPTHITAQGIEFIYVKSGRRYAHKTCLANFLPNMRKLLCHYLDDRVEWEKDGWDVRNLKQYGVSHNLTAISYYMYFDIIRHLAAHLDCYIANMRDHKNANPQQYKNRGMTIMHKFLSDIQLYGYEIASKRDVRTLIYPEDKPKIPKKAYGQTDYIPDYVLTQLFAHINDLHPDAVPVVWIMYKTGLRISDTLLLKHDCLIKLNGKYWLEADIEKTYIKGHRVPIDDQLAAIIARLIDISAAQSNQYNNPERFIFARYSGSRQGNPWRSISFGSI